MADEDGTNAVASSGITKLAAQIWRRIENLPEAQQILRLGNRSRVTGLSPMKRGEIWKLTRPRGQLRFLKYVGGEYFRMHCDACYEIPDKRESSLFTLHLYLNNANTAQGTESIEDKDKCEKSLIGGTTTFNAINAKTRQDVYPKAGRILFSNETW